MKHEPESIHAEYLNSMENIWPQSLEIRNNLYTYDGCATIRELGRVISKIHLKLY
jgi:hypothetical protein